MSVRLETRRRIAGETDSERKLVLAKERLDAALQVLYEAHTDASRQLVYDARVNLRSVCAEYLAEQIPAPWSRPRFL